MKSTYETVAAALEPVFEAMLDCPPSPAAFAAVDATLKKVLEAHGWSFQEYREAVDAQAAEEMARYPTPVWGQVPGTNQWTTAEDRE